MKVFRFLTADTVEEDILERAKRKRVLEHVVIHCVEGSQKSEGKEKEMTFKKEELSAILQFGAEKLFGKDHLKNGAGLGGLTDADGADGAGISAAKPEATLDPGAAPTVKSEAMATD